MAAFALACVCGRPLVRRMWSMGCPACGEAEPNDLRWMLRAGASEAVRPLAEARA